MRDWQRSALLGLLLLILSLVAGCKGEKQQTAARDGELLFQRHCAGCHYGGGNAGYPQKSLHQRELEANGIRSAGAIVAKMRHPGGRMPPFDRERLPDREAKAIAEYIIRAFR